MKNLLSLAIGGTPIQAPADIPTGGIANGSAHTILAGVLTLVLSIAALLALFALIFGGFRWMTSGGDPKAVESARNRIIQGIIGLVIIFLSFTLMAVLGQIFNIQLLGI